MENLGARKSVVGLVIPTGYSFNLDGTSIYLTMAAVFIAQATDTPMTLMQQITLLAVLLLTSKGAAGRHTVQTRNVPRGKRVSAVSAGRLCWPLQGAGQVSCTWLLPWPGTSHQAQWCELKMLRPMP